MKHVTAHAQRLDKLHSTKEAQLRSLWKKKPWKNRQTDEDKHKKRLEAHRKAEERKEEAARRLQEAVRRKEEKRRKLEGDLRKKVDEIYACRDKPGSVLGFELKHFLHKLRARARLVVSEHRTIAEDLARVGDFGDADLAVNLNRWTLQAYAGHGAFWRAALEQGRSYENVGRISPEAAKTEARKQVMQDLYALRAGKILKMFEGAEPFLSNKFLRRWHNNLPGSRLVNEAPVAAVTLAKCRDPARWDSGRGWKDVPGSDKRTIGAYMTYGYACAQGLDKLGYLGYEDARGKPVNQLVDDVLDKLVYKGRVEELLEGFRHGRSLRQVAKRVKKAKTWAQSLISTKRVARDFVRKHRQLAEDLLELREPRPYLRGNQPVCRVHR